jgi:SMODS-associating 2TM, beta-strand rich effector domain
LKKALEPKSTYIWLCLHRYQFYQSKKYLVLSGVTYVVAPSIFLIFFTLHYIFNRLLWKIWPFFYIVKVPNFGGTWRGKLNRQINGTSDEHEIEFQIGQTWLEMSVVLIGKSIDSCSSAIHIVNSDLNNVQIKYIYFARQRDLNNGNNAYGEGTAILKLDQSSSRLEGSYFSSKARVGFISIERKQ